MRRKKKRLILSVLLAAVAAIAVRVAWGNTARMVNGITIMSDRIPQSFSGYRIALISDLHNAEFGDGNAALIGKLAECRPEIVVVVPGGKTD